jgi:two-component system response regulator DegU
MKINVVIFEDNKLVRDALQAILNGTAGLACSAAFSDVNRWDLEVGRYQPDVVLMDIEMPGMNGIEATRRIVEKYPEVKILK